MIKKKIAAEIYNQAEQYRLLQAEELLKKCGYIYDAQKGEWVEKKKLK